MYRALVTFSGTFSMVVGEVKDIPDAAIAKDLLRAGYIIEISPARKDEKPKKRTTKK